MYTAETLKYLKLTFPIQYNTVQYRYYINPLSIWSAGKKSPTHYSMMRNVLEKIQWLVTDDVYCVIITTV